MYNTKVVKFFKQKKQKEFTPDNNTKAVGREIISVLESNTLSEWYNEQINIKPLNGKDL